MSAAAVRAAPRAVVFAYHDVGVRCLRTLLAHGFEVPLVITHVDAPGEQIWFDSVERHAAWHGIRVLTPDDPNVPDVIAEVAAARPDFLFSFYYRSMLGEQLLGLPARSAYNVHGSLLPKYRGRAPVNWAVLHGERKTGATLHAMSARPDAGPIVGREVVPIQPDDTALEVFRKVTVAAELVLHRCLLSLVAGTAPHVPQDPAAATYFGRRRARDGAIDWSLGAARVHNLVRAVAPPYPGAFGQAGGMRLLVRRTLPVPPPALQPPPGPNPAPVLCWQHGRVRAICANGALDLLEFELDGRIDSAEAFQRTFGTRTLALEPVTEPS
ncbi:MAG: formyltransferase [Steroidobacteraceae bacterium]